MPTAPLPPTPGDVVVGILAVLGGGLLLALGVHWARRTGNRLHLVTATGGLLLVAGVVGQQTAAGGAWGAGIAIPVLGVHVDPVAAAGVIMALVGLTLTLLFERVDDGPARAPQTHRPLEDDDTV